MKNIVNRMPMRFKFVCVLLLPLLALSWFAVNGMIERSAALKEYDRLHELTKLAQRAGDAIHQLQLERGMTAGFLGSEGATFGNRLRQQRPSTDAAASARRAGCT